MYCQKLTIGRAFASQRLYYVSVHYKGHTWLFPLSKIGLELGHSLMEMLCTICKAQSLAPEALTLAGENAFAFNKEASMWSIVSTDT